MWICFYWHLYICIWLNKLLSLCHSHTSTHIHANIDSDEKKITMAGHEERIRAPVAKRLMYQRLFSVLVSLTTNRLWPAQRANTNSWLIFMLHPVITCYLKPVPNHIYAQIRDYPTILRITAIKKDFFFTNPWDWYQQLEETSTKFKCHCDLHNMKGWSLRSLPT